MNSSLNSGSPVVDKEAIDEIAGILFPLADQVIALLSDPERRRRMGEAGRQLVSVRYGLDRLIDEVERLYRELLH